MSNFKLLIILILFLTFQPSVQSACSITGAACSINSETTIEKQKEKTTKIQPQKQSTKNTITTKKENKKRNR